MGGVGDLLLSLVKDHTDFLSFDINNTPSVSLVFTLDDAHLITRLEILADATNIHLQLLWQLDAIIIHWVKRHLPLFDHDDRAFDSA